MNVNTAYIHNRNCSAMRKLSYEICRKMDGTEKTLHNQGNLDSEKNTTHSLFHADFNY